MADNDFRAYRSRDGAARDDIDGHVPDSVRDPLAELVRLIGQADPDAEYDRVPQHGPALQYQDASSVGRGQDWAPDGGYDDQAQYADQGYEQPAEPHPALRDYPSYQDDQRPQYDDRYSEPADHYGQSGRHEAVYDDRYTDHELQPLPQGRGLPALAPEQSYEDEYQDEGQWDEDGRPYTGQGYQGDTESRPRRSGLALVVGVLCLVTIGAASAFGYRAMFGGALVPSLPPIIKASGEPNKIVPPSATGTNRADASGQNSGEKLVPREEQPVPIEPQNAPPRVVATIPVLPQSSAVPPPGLAAQPVPAQSFPPPPSAPPSSAPAPTTQSTEPKKVHTVLIKPEQHNSVAPAARSNAPESIAPHSASHTVAPSSPNAPLALVPTAQGGTAQGATPRVAPRSQVARAEPGPGAPLSTAPAAVSSGASAGGYSVQVTSQRSEAEAQASYRELQAKYPAQLGGHHATIHRADLGGKGTYYRAMIGPYPSAEAAAGMCSSIKAAGGSCLVQRN